MRFPELLRNHHARHLAGRARPFEYFRAADDAGVDPAVPDSATLRRIETELDGWFGARLIDAAWPNARANLLASLRQRISDELYALDDLNDAFAALWTARRILLGQAQRIPDEPDIDARGLRMEMWY